MRLKVTMRYDGSRYQGFQKQSDAMTIQGEIEKVVSKIARQPIAVYASGRTDAKVHANHQVIHFDSPTNMDKNSWKRALNSLLPADIFVTDVDEVDSTFHARHDVRWKEYRYLLSTNEYNPMQAKYIFQLGKKLDIAKMRQAAQYFLGEHDFKSFCSNKSEDTYSFVRTISRFDIIENDGLIDFIVVGNGFLRYMVRMLVGTLIEIGLGRQSEEIILSRLDQIERRIVPFNAPPYGLYLNRVEYFEPIHNYHTHTYRCLHAVGEDEDYVAQAIAVGIKTLGFSDHFMSPNIQEGWKMRGDAWQLPEYLQSIRHLQSKHQERITIHVGMECEYFPQIENELRQLLVSKQCDYLILGLHYLYIDENNWITSYSGDIRRKEQLLRYGELAVQALASQLFSVFAHPDLFMTEYEVWDETCEQISYQICQAAKRYDVALEVNLRGMYYFGKKNYRDGIRHPYPHRRFFEIAKEVGNTVIIGIDAHDPNELSTKIHSLGKAFLSELDLNFATKIELKKV